MKYIFTHSHMKNQNNQINSPSQFQIFPETHQISNGKIKVFLRKKEYELLEFLIENKNRVVNRLSILEYVWNYSSTVNTNTVEVHMNQLRKKLSKIKYGNLIETYPRLGYRLSEAFGPETNEFGNNKSRSRLFKRPTP